ncbi:MAG: response regulator [Desulfobulbaceae bacterium]|jgi:DNA-binding NtrC family response regulator|nr:response regulator [Desulfobulbaceae bacterium]
MQNPRVLIVDDEKEFASTLAERLNMRNMEAVAVYCAEDALALIHTADHVPDVVLLDLKMPNIDGLQALEAIKQYDSSIEVIMLTGHGDRKIIEGISSLILDYIIKPVDLPELIKKIGAATQKRRAALPGAEGGTA